MKNKKLLLTILLLFIIVGIFIFNALAHSGNTDANGGHRDNNNKSGLGSYHYHCGGNPPHLHTNGVCPYKSGGTSSGTGSSSSTSSNNITSYSYSSRDDEGYEEGYDDGYEAGYEDGHVEGYHEGFSEGEEKGYDDGWNDRQEEAEEKSSDNNNWVYFSLIGVGVLIYFAVKR